MKDAPLKLNPQVVGNVGMYYVCYKLSLMGWNVMPTARNARGIDVLAYDESGDRIIGVQVKTLSESKKYDIGLGGSLDKVMGDFWVIINNAVVKGERNAFIMTSEEVRKNIIRDKGGKQNYWLGFKTYTADKFKGKWDKIGRGDDNKKPSA